MQILDVRGLQDLAVYLKHHAGALTGQMIRVLVIRGLVGIAPPENPFLQPLDPRLLISLCVQLQRLLLP